MNKTLFNDIGVILAKWDPIGVPPGIAFDEYQSYILGIIKAGRNLEKIKGHLIWILTDQIGLDFDENNPRHNEDVEETAKSILNRIILEKSNVNH